MFFRYYLPVLVWGLTIMVLMLMPGQHIPKIEDNFLLSPDKLAHIAVFFVLTFLMVRALRKQSRFLRLKTQSALFSFIIVGSYSLVLESLQVLVADRMVDIYDGVANLCGCVLGYLVYKAI